MGRLSSNIIHSGFPALRHRNFRLFWFGQAFSMIGSWMQSKVLIFIQTSLAVLAAVLATITYFQIVAYWHILILALLLGIVNTLDMPTRQAFVIELVNREDLTNAIALNSSVFNLGRIVGPAVAGLLIGWVGIAVCFYLNAASFSVVIAGLWLIRVSETTRKQSEFGSLKQIYRDIHEGLGYINKREIIKQPLLLLALTSMFVMNFNIFVPVFAQQELSMTAKGYGLLMTSMGVGSFLGSLALVAKSRGNPRLRYLIGGALCMSVFLLFLSQIGNFRLSCLMLFLIGFGSIIFTTLVNTTIQINSSDEMRGRVMSVYTLVFGGVIPIGSLFAGQVTEYAGASGCMLVSGIIGIAATAYSIYAMHRKTDKD